MMTRGEPALNALLEGVLTIVTRTTSPSCLTSASTTPSKTASSTERCRSSEVKDATESGVSGSKQQSQAYFRKLRVVGRSASEFRVLRGTQEQSRFWRMKVLVKVPRSEYDAVLAWKQKREDEAKALKLAQEQQAETLLSQQLETAKASAREGNLLGALKQLQLFRETAPQVKRHMMWFLLK